MKRFKEILGTHFETAIVSNVNVLVSGETGTGKSFLAQEIHKRSARSKGPWVPVNLASQHEATLESALFGFEKGAFTGADRTRKGLFEMAHGGTLFLDEIAELSLHLQARLLEFLQTRTLRSMGSNTLRTVDVRFIFATHQDLEEKVRRGEFREDLLHRIRMVELRLPSLREFAADDFAKSVHDILEKCANTHGKVIHTLSKECVEYLEMHLWPGNFRELEHVLEVAVLQSRETQLRLDDFPGWWKKSVEQGAVRHRLGEVYVEPVGQGGRPRVRAEWDLISNYPKLLKKIEKTLMDFAIRSCQGNWSQAAQAAGVPRASFYRKAIALGLVPQFPKNDANRLE